VHTPGTRTGYHGLTYGFIVGEIIQRVTGKQFSNLVQSEIVKPLGLDGMYIGAPKKELHRAAQLIFPKTTKSMSKTSLGPFLEVYACGMSNVLRAMGADSDLSSIFDALAPRGISDFEFNAHGTLRAAIPSANGLFTARSLAKMYAMLAAGGEFNGTRLMSQDTVRKAGTLQKPTGKNSVIPFDMRWRLGYHAVATTRGFPVPGPTPAWICLWRSSLTAVWDHPLAILGRPEWAVQRCHVPEQGNRADLTMQVLTSRQVRPPEYPNIQQLNNSITQCKARFHGS
jgi:CubicO group peptidase (beta-lactamase class C family)